MTTVRRLGYIGYDVKDIAAWDNLLVTVYGLEMRRDSPRKARHYRLDERHHRISLYPATSDGISFIGWEVDTRGELQAIGEHLDSHGVKVTHGSKAQIKERAVMDLVCLQDPDGFNLEIFCTGLLDNKPFKPSRALVGYKTGDLGLGHIVLFTNDPDESARWYQDLLGFRISDYIYWEDARVTFMHCNGRHHSLAVMNASFGRKAGDFNHLMLEAISLDDIGRAYDIVNENNYPIALTLGRHTNDRITSFYVYNPSGHLIEYGWGGELVDDAIWEPKFYDAPQIWGHVPQPPPER